MFEKLTKIISLIRYKEPDNFILIKTTIFLNDSTNENKQAESLSLLQD